MAWSGLMDRWGWRAARVSAFALVSVSIGALGHALTSGVAVDLRVLLVGLSVALLWGWLMTFDRQPAALLVATVVIVQAGIHGAAKLHAPTPVTSEHAHHAANAAGPEQGLLGTSVLAMIGVHALATLLGVALLLRLERRALRAARRIGLVVLSLLRAPGRRFRSSPDLPSAPGVRPQPAFPRWWIAVRGCRGPPEACVGFR